jgi:hypothetical protein
MPLSPASFDDFSTYYDPGSAGTAGHPPIANAALLSSTTLNASPGYPANLSISPSTSPNVYTAPIPSSYSYSVTNTDTTQPSNFGSAGLMPPNAFHNIPYRNQSNLLSQATYTPQAHELAPSTPGYTLTQPPIIESTSAANPPYQFQYWLPPTTDGGSYVPQQYPYRDPSRGHSPSGPKSPHDPSADYHFHDPKGDTPTDLNPPPFSPPSRVSTFDSVTSVPMSLSFTCGLTIKPIMGARSTKFKQHEGNPHVYHGLPAGLKALLNKVWRGIESGKHKGCKTM